MPLLTGTGFLADDLYLLAHDDLTGRPLLAQRALGTGLAGALLGELALAGAIRARAGEVIPTDWAPPADGLAIRVFGRLAAEQAPGQVRDWLIVLAATAVQDVACRLASAGYLTTVTSRRLPRSRARWMPVDSACAFAPHIRARSALDPVRVAGAFDTTLAGLAVACGLGPRLLPYGPPGARAHLGEQVRRLPPTLRELVAQTQAVIDHAVLSHRL